MLRLRVCLVSVHGIRAVNPSVSSLYLFQDRDGNHGAVGATTDCLTPLRTAPLYNDRLQQPVNARIRGIVVGLPMAAIPRPDIALVHHFQSRPGLLVQASRSQRCPPSEKST
jgi:hypothetical protein